MIDSGSNKDIISSQLCRRLRIPTTKREIRLSTFGGVSCGQQEIAKFSIDSLDGLCKIEVKSAIVSDVIRSVADKQATNAEVAKFPYLRGVVIDELPNSPVDILISNRHAWASETGQVIRGPKNLPLAKKTELGWCLMGSDGKEAEVDVTSLFCINADEEVLRQTIEKYFRRDFYFDAEAETLCPSDEDNYAIAQVKEGLVQDGRTGKYKCPIPFRGGRTNAAKILNSRNYDDISQKRTQNVVRRMQREPERKAGVLKSMNEMIDEGYAVRADSLPPPPPEAPRCALPLHVDTRKPGKFRVCHDAAQKIEGVCLNDLILPGPDLMNDHIKVLMNYRRHPYCSNADIKGFFYQVGVDEYDRYVLKFYWYENDDLIKPCAFMIVVHPFGTKSSPMVATYVLRHHALVNAEEFGPEVVDAILNCFYVDDFLRSFPTIEAAKRMHVELTAALKKGGFDLVKWKANHPDILGNAPAAGEDTISLKDSTDVVAFDKVLGINYAFATDAFFFKLKPGRGEEFVDTRRKLLSLVASIYDPLGLIGPFVLLGRIQFQKSITRIDGWDSLMPGDLTSSFDEWRKSIPKLAKFSIPRWIATPSTTNSIPEVHVFSDASLEGYGIAVYRVSPSDGGGAPHVALIFCRNRVVPLNAKTSGHHNSVPRLELVAAVLGAEERKKLISRMNEPVARVVHWMDSTCVIRQLQSMNIRFKSFVHNRRSRFLAITPIQEVRYCPTELNPADDCSRGLLPEDPKWERFHNGPDFLRRGIDFWPPNIVPETLDEAEICATMATEIFAIEAEDVDAAPEPEPRALMITNNLEKWAMKVKRVAIVFKAFKALLRWRISKRPVDIIELRPSLRELDIAEKDIVRAIQIKHFGPEILVLKRFVIRDHDARKELKSRASPLVSLNPFIDVDEVMRAGGRLANAVNLSFDAKYPVILPRKNHVVDSLIRHSHRLDGHCGVEYTHNQLRQKWWIIQGRQAVRGVLGKCVPCQRQKKPVEVQKMGPLPASRLEIGAPFQVAGVDVCGPFASKIGKSRATFKVYCLVCTCFTSRAIHLEPLEDLSTAAFLRALTRIQARRPAIRQLFSDNGTNFRGANTELSQAFDDWKQSELVGEHLRPLEWVFNVPYAPARGGVYERCVKSVKEILTMIMERERISYDAFHTVLVAAEAIVNRRPITQVSSDVKDVNALTPSDILYPGAGCPSGTYLFNPGSATTETLQIAHRIGISYVNNFWKVWKKNYLSTLLQRQKWRSTTNNLKMDDLVILVDDLKHRDLWSLGRINDVDEEVSHVRKVGIRLANGKQTYRDRSKIVLLEVDE